MTNEVIAVAAAVPEAMAGYIAAKLSFETDCADVGSAMSSGAPGFVLVDVRGRKAFKTAHVPGAVNIPVLDLTERRLAGFAPDTLFVVYCAGPHCNGADKAALRLARLGRPVKIMIGGITGWADEGFAFAQAAPDSAAVPTG